MSHFSVIVIGDDFEQQLAPYHEFECTGDDNQYVVDIDLTTEKRAEYSERTQAMLRAPDGTLHSFFDAEGKWRPEFSRVENADAHDIFQRRVEFVPEGYERIEVPLAQVQSFASWLHEWCGFTPVPFGKRPDLSGEAKYGYALLDEHGDVVKCIDRTNPNAKWDWWEVGGRWRGFFKAREGANGVLGEPGVFGNDARPGYVDSLYVEDIDWLGMWEDAAGEAAKRYDAVHDTLAKHNCPMPERWMDVSARYENIDDARRAYHEQPGVRVLEQAKLMPLFRDVAQEYGMTRDEYMARAARVSVVPFAVVKDGQWHEKGSMGWWGISTDGMSEDEWAERVYAMLRELPAGTLLTAVDCHI